jgi:ribonuclease P protein component
MPHIQPSVESLSGFGTFTRVITHGKKHEKKPITAFVYNSPGMETSLCVGFAVSKGIKTAVHRNRVKRLMRQAFQLNKVEFIKKIRDGMFIEIVFMYRDDPGMSTHQARLTPIHNALSSLCTRTNIFGRE